MGGLGPEREGARMSLLTHHASGHGRCDFCCSPSWGRSPWSWRAFRHQRPVADAANTHGPATCTSVQLVYTIACRRPRSPSTPTPTPRSSSSGNIIVRGTLIMKPANGNVDHILRFTGINENNFVGGGMDPLASRRRALGDGCGPDHPPGRVEAGLVLHLPVLMGRRRGASPPPTPRTTTPVSPPSRRPRPRTPSATAPNCST